MNNIHRNQVSDLERELQARFNKDNLERFSSTAKAAADSDYIEELVVPENQRGLMPYTKEELVISENPLRIGWEKEVRKFLKRLPSHTSHRITAPMIYEWATNIRIKDLEEADRATLATRQPGESTHMGRLNTHLRHINWVLKEYFGKPYKTKILGREVGRAYTVRQEFRVKNKRPANMSLWPEWYEGTLVP